MTEEPKRFRIEAFANDRWSIEYDLLDFEEAKHTLMCVDNVSEKPRIIVNRETLAHFFLGKHLKRHKYAIEIYNQKHDSWTKFSKNYTLHEAIMEMTNFHDTNQERYRIMEGKNIICYSQNITTAPFHFAIDMYLASGEWATLYDNLCIDDADKIFKRIDKENECHHRMSVPKNEAVIRYGKLGMPKEKKVVPQIQTKVHDVPVIYELYLKLMNIQHAIGYLQGKNPSENQNTSLTITSPFFDAITIKTFELDNLTMIEALLTESREIETKLGHFGVSCPLFTIDGVEEKEYKLTTA